MNVNGLPSWWGAALPCGCVRGVRLCAVGVQLWDDVADDHKILARAFNGGTHDDGRPLNVGVARNVYEAAMQKFTDHVEIVAEAGIQRPML